MSDLFCVWTYRIDQSFEKACTASCNNAGILYRKGMKYCPYCGKVISVVKTGDTNDDRNDPRNYNGIYAPGTK